MADRDEIVRFMSDLLEAASYTDILPVGLQVPGAREVKRIASGVSASLELFERAAAEGADMVLAHHGLFVGSGPRPPMSEPEKLRLKTLFDHDLSLVAYHLALDAHPEVGNNAILCDRLGIRDLEPFGQEGPRTIGFAGALSPPATIGELVDRVREHVTPAPLVFRDGPPLVYRAAVISGSAAGYIQAAADAGADCFITGEPKEPAMADAREAGIHFIAAGHYCTEVFGVQALGQKAADRFGIEHVFVDIPNPI
jgi:dinuclear metal center YbgI/SA1388 family protein